MAAIASGMAQNRDSGMAPAWDLVSLAKAGEYARVTAASLCDLAATTQMFLFAGIVLVSTRLARALKISATGLGAGDGRRRYFFGYGV